MKNFLHPKPTNSSIRSVIIESFNSLINCTSWCARPGHYSLSTLKLKFINFTPYLSRLFTNIESYVVRYVKEQVGEVSLDFQEEMMSSPKAIEVDIEKFNLPDEKKYVIVFVRLYFDLYLPLMHLF